MSNDKDWRYYCDCCNFCTQHCECGPSGNPSPGSCKIVGTCAKCKAGMPDYDRAAQRGLDGLRQEILSSRTSGPLVIGVAGGMGSGKDTIAAMLRMVGYRRVAFGDRVKAEVYNYLAGLDSRRAMVDSIFIRFGVNPDTLRPRGPVALHDIAAKVRWCNLNKLHLREVLQYWGTDFRRGEDPEYWIKRTEDEIRKSGVVCIPDARFQNEVDFIHSRGGKVWRLSGRHSPESKGLAHFSEQPANLTGIDLEIDNSVDMYGLAGAVIDGLRR